MLLTPQVETAEMSDTDLDEISGGQAGGASAGAGAAAGLYVEAGPVGVGTGAGVAVSPECVSADLHLHTTMY